VKAPRYVVRLAEQLSELPLTLGAILYYAADRASFVFTHTLRSIKGSDASNVYDEEIHDDVCTHRSTMLKARSGNFQMMRRRWSTSEV
jgi:hypothetical protein